MRHTSITLLSCLIMLSSKSCLSLLGGKAYRLSNGLNSCSSLKLFSSLIRANDEWISLKSDVCIIGGGHAGCEAAGVYSNVMNRQDKVDHKCIDICTYKFVYLYY